MLKHTLLRFLVVTSLLAPVVFRAQPSPPGMVIGVRSGVDSADKEKRDRDPAYANDPRRARLFVLAHVQEEKNGLKLVKTVNAVALAKEVTAQLVAQGFHPVQPGQKPDIVVTVKYGRGFLPNPYTDSDGDKQRTNLSNTDLLAVWPTHDRFVGLEHNRQRAAQESLVIQVRAWKYPPPKDPKKKEELLWMTTVHVDDPEHRDLNEISGKMLAVGAPYFDHHIAREGEVLINTALPEGHVNVGTPEVVPPQPSK
jgi:hypothetical protein